MLSKHLKSVYQSWKADKADKTADLMLILGDYNASVQSAPMPQSGVYEARRASITKAWDAHKAS